MTRRRFIRRKDNSIEFKVGIEEDGRVIDTITFGVMYFDSVEETTWWEERIKLGFEGLPLMDDIERFLKKCDVRKN